MKTNKPTAREARNVSREDVAVNPKSHGRARRERRMAAKRRYHVGREA